MIMSGVALAILASVMAWSASSARLTHRSIQYTRSVAAAEAATEKVMAQVTRDFHSGGENLVVNNLNSYRLNTVPTTADSPYWANWQFDDGKREFRPDVWWNARRREQFLIRVVDSKVSIYRP